MLDRLFPGLFGGDLLQTTLAVLGFVFLVCALVPKVRPRVFGPIDGVIASIVPGKGPTAEEIADAIEARRKTSS